jgi:CRISPR-associated protein Csb2
MTLRLEIEWLGGVCYAARDPATSRPDWPIQPDRVFSALVASWGALGEPADGRAALEWLERAEPPRLRAAEGRPRSGATRFVPPNDDAGWRSSRFPERRRQPRGFPATVLPLERTHLVLEWAEAPPAEVAAPLATIAAATSYVGHSAALTRCQFVADGESPHELGPITTTAAPQTGRLKCLSNLFQLRRAEEEVGRNPDTRFRPSGAPLGLELAPPVAEPPRSVFAADWTVLAPEGRAPDLRAAAALASALRAALIAAWADHVPAWLHGHDENGGPAIKAHLATVPLANVGFEHSDGDLKGLALVPPREVAQRWAEGGPSGFAERAHFACVVAQALGNEHEPWRGGGTGWAVQSASGLQSLQPERWCGVAARWATATPIALDRHLKNGLPPERDEDTAEQILRACERIGLPRPVAVRPAKHSAVRGAPPARPAGGNPRHVAWKRPDKLGARALVHAVIEFAQPVRGPVILGAGRFRGLGMCLPIGR